MFGYFSDIPPWQSLYPDFCDSMALVESVLADLDLDMQSQPEDLEAAFLLSTHSLPE